MIHKQVDRRNFTLALANILQDYMTLGASVSWVEDNPTYQDGVIVSFGTCLWFFCNGNVIPNSHESKPTFHPMKDGTFIFYPPMGWDLFGNFTCRYKGTKFLFRQPWPVIKNTENPYQLPLELAHLMKCVGQCYSDAAPYKQVWH